MSARLPHFEIARSVDGQFFARMVAANGKRLLTSETYQRKRACRRAIEIASGPDRDVWDDSGLRICHEAYGWLDVRDLT